MKSIFLVKDTSKIGEVYSDDVLDKLVIKTGIDVTDIYSEKTVREKKEKFNKVEYIFSTWYMPTFSESDVRELFPNLKAVFYAAGTVKYFAEPFLNCGIRVFNAGAANAIPVAEYVVAQIILANKGYFQAQLAYKKGLYKISYKKAYSFAEKRTGNYNCNVGLIGAGIVGSKVIELLKSYNINVLVYDPYLNDNRADQMRCKKVSLETLFMESQIVSNHLPDNKQTRGMITYELFSKMQESATFINTGRGEQVVEKDLIRILKERPYMCALLDVTRHEPMFPFNPLYRFKNAFITPHIAGSMKNEQQRMAECMIEAYGSYIVGEQSKFEITKEMLANMA
jgi:phosphoglycerate dehydrogenase-like enzyme